MELGSTKRMKRWYVNEVKYRISSLKEVIATRFRYGYSVVCTTSTYVLIPTVVSLRIAFAGKLMTNYYLGNTPLPIGVTRAVVYKTNGNVSQSANMHDRDF